MRVARPWARAVALEGLRISKLGFLFYNERVIGIRYKREREHGPVKGLRAAKSNVRVGFRRRLGGSVHYRHDHVFVTVCVELSVWERRLRRVMCGWSDLEQQRDTI